MNKTVTKPFSLLLVAYGEGTLSRAHVANFLYTSLHFPVIISDNKAKKTISFEEVLVCKI
jgi:hypothetical protein